MFLIFLFVVIAILFLCWIVTSNDKENKAAIKALHVRVDEHWSLMQVAERQYIKAREDWSKALIEATQNWRKQLGELERLVAVLRKDIEILQVRQRTLEKKQLESVKTINLTIHDPKKRVTK